MLNNYDDEGGHKHSNRNGKFHFKKNFEMHKKKVPSEN